MALPESQDIDFIQGNTLEFGWSFTSEETGEVEDLTGIDFVFRIVDRNETQLIRLTTEDSTLQIDDPLSGIMTAVLTPVQTRTLPRGALSFYEVEARFVGGDQKTWVRGRMIGASPVANDDV